MADDCAGRGQCHGSVAWCNACGDVKDICSAVDCDRHHRTGGRSVELARLLEELNTPELMDFIKGISEEDAKAEGVESAASRALNGVEGPAFWLGGERPGLDRALHESASHAFADLWESINGERAPWASNPWVWIVSFKPVSAPARGSPRQQRARGLPPTPPAAVSPSTGPEGTPP